MERKGRQDSTMGKEFTDIEVMPKQQVLVGDQVSCGDEELIIHYLDKKMIDQRFPDHTVHEVDFFLHHPRQLTQMHSPSQGKEWYFLSPASKKDTVGRQSSSENNDGYWQPCGTVSLIHKDGKLIGYRKTLKYIEGKHEKDIEKTEWLMHEYRLERSKDIRTGTTSDEVQWVLCKLFKLNDNLIAAEEKEVEKVAGPDDGASSMDQTIQGSEKANSTINDKAPITGLTGDLLTLPDTDLGSATSYSLLDQASKMWGLDKTLTGSSQHEPDQATTLPTPTPQQGQTTSVTPPGRRKATKKAVNSKRPTNRRKRDLLPLLDSDQDSVMPQLPQIDQGTVLPPPLPQIDQRREIPTFTGTHKANIGVITEGPSNSLNSDSNPLTAASQGFMIPHFDPLANILNFGGTSANTSHQHGTMPPAPLQHGLHTISPQPYQQAMIPPLTGIQSAKNDEVNPVRPTSNDYHDARDLLPSVQVPTLPSEGDARDLLPSVQVPTLPSEGHVSQHGSPNNEAAAAEVPMHGVKWPCPSGLSWLPSYKGPFGPLSEEELAFFDNPDLGYPEAFENNKEAK